MGRGEKITAVLCKTMDVGANNTMFGGQMLFYVDDAAAVYAYSVVSPGSRLVTYRIGETLFRRPVRLGETVTFYGGEPRFTRHSVTFKISVMVGNELCVETEAVMVSVDQDGNKTPFPDR